MSVGALPLACGGENHPAEARGDKNTVPESDGGGSDSGALIAEGHADACQKPINSGFAGDDLCIDPPAPDVGYQLHFGPSDYSDPAELAKYTLAPGVEEVKCVYLHTPNTETKFYSEYHVRMRGGTHHMILWAPTAATHDMVSPPPDGTLTDSCRNLDYTFELGAQSGIGPQGASLDVPQPGKSQPKENEGLAYQDLPNTSVAMETHYINTGGDPILREVWINLIYEDPATVKNKIDSVFWIGGLGMNVPPYSKQTITAGPAMPPTPPAGQSIRILGLTGHVHAHTTHESVWLSHASGDKELIYETYNWSDPLIASYDSAHVNPKPGLSSNSDGAPSGDLILQAGDSVSWECDVDNTTGASLKFADLAYTAEMCNVFGFFAPGTGGEWASFNE
ncbi:MAG TPA: hypothetical protein VHC69_18775 [Polyangiaceae bacterium]|nr:hypothetical protein [Polyangiaceae bacterium]